MTEPKTHEALEAEWWDRWWLSDYSWNGLARRGLGGGFVSFGARGLFGEESLQEYWRHDPKTGHRRTDDEMRAAGELISGIDGEPWHLAHVPLKWKDHSPAKNAWAAELTKRVYQILLQRLKTSKEGQGILDGRAQFSGIVLNRSLYLETAKLQDGRPRPLYLSCDNAWLHSLFGPGIIFSGDLNLSDSFISEMTSFSGAVFEGNLICESVRFGGDAHFDAASFKGDLIFTEAFALKMLKFDHAHFFRNASFERAVVKGLSSFVRGKFNQFAVFTEANFGQDVAFVEVEFSGKVSFFESKFMRKATFDATRFTGVSDFSLCSFEEIPIFSAVKIEEDILFERAKFLQGAFFDRILSWGRTPTSCSRCFFGATAAGSLTFDGSPPPFLGAFNGLHLERGALLSFDDPGTKATLASFSEQLSSINDAKENAPVSKEKMLPDRANRLLDDLAGGCRVLKKYFESQGDRERSQRFFRLELEARMKSDDIGRLERLIFWAYRGSSDYGASIGRPLLWLGAAFLGFGFFYWAFAALWLAPEVTFDWRVLIGSLDFSLRQTFPFVIADMKADNTGFNMRRILLGDGDRWQNLLVRSVTVLQTTFSLAMIFLAGLAIRRRFKMD